MITNNSIITTKISRRNLTQFHFNFLIQSFQPVCLGVDMMMRITCKLLLCTNSERTAFPRLWYGFTSSWITNQSPPLEANQAVQPLVSSSTEAKGWTTWDIQVLLNLCNSRETLISTKFQMREGLAACCPFSPALPVMWSGTLNCSPGLAAAVHSSNIFGGFPRGYFIMIFLFSPLFVKTSWSDLFFSHESHIKKINWFIARQIPHTLLCKIKLGIPLFYSSLSFLFLDSLSSAHPIYPPLLQVRRFIFVLSTCCWALPFVGSDCQQGPAQHCPLVVHPSWAPRWSITYTQPARHSTARSPDHALFIHPFICDECFKWLPGTGWCKWCCYEHWGACIFSN